MPTEKPEPQAEHQSPPAESDQEAKPLAPSPEPIFEPIHKPIATQIRWRLMNVLQSLGIDSYHEKEKVAAIIEHFKFKDMDDATLRLHEVIHHSRQEAQGRPKEERKYNAEGALIIPTNRMPAQPEIVDLIFSRMKKDPYTQPITGCHVFSYLLVKIGEQLGHKCHMISCDPEYLRGSNGKGNGHVAVFDETANVYRDASVYRAYRGDDRKWVYSQPYPQRTNVPEKDLNIQGDPLTHYDKKGGNWVAEKPNTKSQ